VTAERYVLVEGLRSTRSVLSEWNGHPWRTIGAWTALSLGIAAALLYSVYAVAKFSIPDPMESTVAGINRPAAGWGDAKVILFRNSLVIALHAMVCVAVFIATSAMPQVSAGMSALWRRVHDLSGTLAIVFVTCATLFSLVTQAYALGRGASDMSALLGTRPSWLLITLLPHALPELTAVFLPLGACLIITARRRNHQLLAATFVTVAIGFPVLVATAVVEVWFTPLLIDRLVCC